MNRALTIALAVAAAAIASPAMAQITFYENEGFQGRSFTATKQVSDFERYGFQRPGLVGRGQARPLGSLRGRALRGATAWCCVRAVIRRSPRWA